MNSQDQIMQFLLSNPYIFLLLISWVLFWKGIALWMSAKRDQKYWFVALLVLNTLGILEILYILYIKYKEKKDSQEELEEATNNNENTD